MRKQPFPAALSLNWGGGGLLPLIACESKVNRLTMQEKNDMLDVHFEADTVEMFLKC